MESTKYKKLVRIITKKQTLTYIENKPVVAMGRGIGGATQVQGNKR